MHDHTRKPWRHRVGMIAAEALGALVLIAGLVAIILVFGPLGPKFADFMASLGGGA